MSAKHTPGDAVPGAVGRNPHFGRVQSDGRVIVDERCACGCSRSAHADNGPALGHGACQSEMRIEGNDHRICGCARFTWASFRTTTARRFAAIAKAEGK